MYIRIVNIFNFTCTISCSKINESIADLHSPTWNAHKFEFVFTFVEAKVILNNRYICSHYIPYLNLIPKRYKGESLTFFSLYFRTGSLENTVQFV